MDENELLNFNYPLESQNYIQVETKLKQALRRNNFNFTETKDIKRYSDRHTSPISRMELLKTINVELLNSELQKYYGIKTNTEGNIIVRDDDDDDEYVNNNCSDQSTENFSIEGTNDYEQNYYDEDEYIDDNDHNEEVF
ncbi:hypothetical protein GINT2_000190 [Glugoides intestinalis]